MSSETGKEIRKGISADEKVIEIHIERLKDFCNHPFHVLEDPDMAALRESIQNFGILSPLVVRPKKDGDYEIISGHRRKYAAMQLGYRKLPVIIRVLSDDDSIISMVDSNLQREQISFSEKAHALKMKNEAMKRKAGRNRGQIDPLRKGVKTVELIGKASGDSPKQVQRFIKLTELIPSLLSQLDHGMIGFSPAVELAYLQESDQQMILDAMNYAQTSPSLSQAQRLRKLSQEGKLTKSTAEDILSEIKKGEISRVTFSNAQLHRFFPRKYTAEQMKREILMILANWISDTDYMDTKERNLEDV